MSSAPAILLTDRAEAASRALPPLLVEAERIAATVILGVHGRKRAGPGENFWQYRPYSFGDSVQRIDWHKSARSDRVFIRENEWEAANTLWLWASPTATMAFKSHLAKATKRDRAMLIALALGALAVRAHERVAAIGSPLAPGHARASLARIADWMQHQEGPGLPAAGPMRRYSSAVLLADFYERPDDIRKAVTGFAASGINGHLIQVVDPAEETLPYAGRMEFREMAGPLRFLASKTELLREAYAEKFRDHREALRDIAFRAGWSFTAHRTDRSVAHLLMLLHGLIGGAKSRAFGMAGIA
jgi:uncharacterized protein (DUF58 family)